MQDTIKKVFDIYLTLLYLDSVAFPAREEVLGEKKKGSYA